MPVYTYRCDACGVQFEKHQSFHDNPLKTCPECRKKKLRKVITPSKIIFKGSGFYATDHKSPSGSKSRRQSCSFCSDRGQDPLLQQACVLVKKSEHQDQQPNDSSIHDRHKHGRRTDVLGTAG